MLRVQTSSGRTTWVAAQGYVAGGFEGRLQPLSGSGVSSSVVARMAYGEGSSGSYWEAWCIISSLGLWILAVRDQRSWLERSGRLGSSQRQWRAAGVSGH